MLYFNLYSASPLHQVPSEIFHTNPQGFLLQQTYNVLELKFLPDLVDQVSQGQTVNYRDFCLSAMTIATPKSPLQQIKNMRLDQYREALDWINHLSQNDPLSRTLLSMRLNCMAYMVFECKEEFHYSLAQYACLALILAQDSDESLEMSAWSALALLYPNHAEQYFNKAHNAKKGGEKNSSLYLHGRCISYIKNRQEPLLQTIQNMLKLTENNDYTQLSSFDFPLAVSDFNFPESDRMNVEKRLEEGLFEEADRETENLLIQYPASAYLLYLRLNGLMAIFSQNPPNWTHVLDKIQHTAFHALLVGKASSCSSLLTEAWISLGIIESGHNATYCFDQAREYPDNFFTNSFPPAPLTVFSRMLSPNVTDEGKKIALFGFYKELIEKLKPPMYPMPPAYQLSKQEAQRFLPPSYEDTTHPIPSVFGVRGSPTAQSPTSVTPMPTFKRRNPIIRRIY